MSLLVGVQGVPADSVRRAVREVFARSEYQWGERSHLLQWLVDWWRKLLSALASLDTSHPILARVIFWVAVVALLGVLAHFGYVAWRIYRATVRPLRATAAPTRVRLGDARAFRRRADAPARAGRGSAAVGHPFIP